MFLRETDTLIITDKGCYGLSFLNNGQHSKGGTFPEPTQALVLEDVSVSLHGAAVAAGHSIQIHLGLESNLDHIGGLRKGHRHGTCGAASQDTYQYTRVWREGKTQLF